MKPSRTRNALEESSLCQFPFSDGRTCRMLRHHSHPTLCIFHARQEQELASLSGGFQTVSDIHHVIGKLFKLVAANRIPPRHAQILGHLLRLLLHSQDDVRQEFLDAQDYNNWEDLLREIYPAAPRSPAPAQTPASQTPPRETGLQSEKVAR